MCVIQNYFLLHFGKGLDLQTTNICVLGVFTSFQKLLLFIDWKVVPILLCASMEGMGVPGDWVCDVSPNFIPIFMLR